MIDQAPANLRFRSDVVWPWGLFFSELGEYLSGEVPSLRGCRSNSCSGIS